MSLAHDGNIIMFQRGVKRKSALQLDSDSEQEADSKPSSREKTPEKPSKSSMTRKLVVVSDEDDDEPIPMPKAASKSKPKAKPTIIDSDDESIPSKAEMSLRAIMDIDDGGILFLILRLIIIY